MEKIQCEARTKVGTRCRRHFFVIKGEACCCNRSNHNNQVAARIALFLEPFTSPLEPEASGDSAPTCLIVDSSKSVIDQQVAEVVDDEIRVLSLNIDGSTSEKGAADARKLVLQAIFNKTKPDLGFLQEIKYRQDNLLKYLTDLTYCMRSSGNVHHKSSYQHAAVLFKPEKFDFVEQITPQSESLTQCVKEIAQKRIVQDSTGKRLEPPESESELSKYEKCFMDLLSRTCMVHLKPKHKHSKFAILAVSVHGIYKVEDSEKLKQVKALLDILYSLAKKKNLVVIVAGDFNADINEDVGLNPCESGQFAVAEIKRTGRRKINRDFVLLQSHASISLVEPAREVALLSKEKEQWEFPSKPTEPGGQETFHLWDTAVFQLLKEGLKKLQSFGRRLLDHEPVMMLLSLGS